MAENNPKARSYFSEDRPEPAPRLEPAQCRAARGLLDWTQEQLAERAGVSRSTVRDFEAGKHDLHRASDAQIVRAFNEAGVIMIGPCGQGVGVVLA